MNDSEFVSDRELSNDYDGPMIAVAHGAMSEGFIVRHRCRRMFVKRLRSEFLSDPRCRAAFEKEFELGYSLEHPGIVRYYELRECAGSVEILMELVEGDNLAAFIDKNDDYFKKRDNFERFMSQLTSAIDYLHSHGIVHLDLKPENIMLTRIGKSVKVIDLGLGASDMFCDSKGGSPLTSAPEVTSGEGRITSAADIYSIGAIMEHIVANGGCKLPGIPKIIARCKSAYPDRRPASAGDITAELNNAIRRKRIIARATAPLLLSFAIAAFIIINKVSDNNGKNAATAVPVSVSVHASELPAEKSPGDTALPPLRRADIAA